MSRVTDITEESHLDRVAAALADLSLSKALAYDALLDSLRALASRWISEAPQDQENFNRRNIIELIDTLAAHLGDALMSVSGTLEDGSTYGHQHPVELQLRSLSEAFRDLDTGKTDPIFIATSHGANKSRTWRERAEDDLFVDMFWSVFKSQNHKSQKLLAERLSDNFGKQTLPSGSIKWRNKDMSAEQYIRLIQRHKRRK